MSNAKIEAKLSALAADWAFLGKTPAQVADLIEWKRDVLIEAAANDAPLRLSPWLGRTPVSEHSTMTYADQGITRR